MNQSLLDQQQQLQRVLKLTFPETTLVVDAPLQMQQALQRLRAQVGAAHPAQPEVMMGLLMGSVPGSNTLRGIRYDGRTLVLHMQTPPSLSADQQRRLQQLGYVVKLTRESVSLTWEGTP
jgi:general secretion pathway protein L